MFQPSRYNNLTTVTKISESDRFVEPWNYNFQVQYKFSCHLKDRKTSRMLEKLIPMRKWPFFVLFRRVIRTLVQVGSLHRTPSARKAEIWVFPDTDLHILFFFLKIHLFIWKTRFKKLSSSLKNCKAQCLVFGEKVMRSLNILPKLGNYFQQNETVMKVNLSKVTYYVLSRKVLIHLPK